MTPDPDRTARGGSSRARGRARRTQPRPGARQSRDHRYRPQSLHRSAAASDSAAGSPPRLEESAAARRPAWRGKPPASMIARRAMPAATHWLSLARGHRVSRACAATPRPRPRPALGPAGGVTRMSSRPRAPGVALPVRAASPRSQPDAAALSAGSQAPEQDQVHPKETASRQVLSRRTPSRRVLSWLARWPRVASRRARR